MADLTAIQKSLFTALNGDPVIAAAVSGIFDTSAPHETTYPYLVVSIIDVVDMPNLTKEIDFSRIQIDIYDQGGTSQTAETILRAVDSALAYKLTGDDTLTYLEARCYPEQVRKTREATDVWRLSRDYRIMWEKTSTR